MTQTTITTEVDLVVEECITCGVPFAMTKELIESLQYTGKTFYCPNGHTMIFGGEREKLQRRLKQLENDRNWYKDEVDRKTRQLSATRGQLTKIKNRIANGVCPCCHRQFVNVQRHMKTKHPDYENIEEEQG